MVGTTVATQQNVIGAAVPSPSTTSIAVAAYATDVHPVEIVPMAEKTADGLASNKRAVVEGCIDSVSNGRWNPGDDKTGPWEIPYEAICPRAHEVTNLLVPVALSASHVAFATIRLEATWMALGQSAGVAAAMAAKKRVPVLGVPRAELRAALLAAGQVLDAHRPLPQVAARWDFASPNKPLCDTVGGACLVQHDASDPVAAVAGTGAVFGPDRPQRISAARSSVPRLTAIAGADATVSIVAWLRPARGYLRGGFVGGLWDEGDAARQFALYMGPMARCKVPAGLVGHISADGGPPADIGHLACESAACGSTSLAATESWHCVAVTYDGKAIRAYLNGSLDDETHLHFNGSSLNPFLYPDPPVFPRGGIFSPPAGHPAADIAFGANFINHGHGKVLSSGGFRGTLRSYAVWAEALSAAQISEACQATQPLKTAKSDDDANTKAGDGRGWEDQILRFGLRVYRVRTG